MFINGNYPCEVGRLRITVKIIYKGSFVLIER